jgi:hypothetical protein
MRGPPGIAVAKAIRTFAKYWNIEPSICIPSAFCDIRRPSAPNPLALCMNSGAFCYTSRQNFLINFQEYPTSFLLHPHSPLHFSTRLR